MGFSRSEVEDEAWKVFVDMMEEDGVPDEDWDFLFPGFLEQYVDDANWEMFSARNR